jgi:trk system potassium uptake protein TrkA
VVRNYSPHQRSLLEAFGLQVISPSSWGAQRIEELVSGLAVHTVFSAGNGEVEVYEFAVPAEWAGRNLSDMLPEGQAIAVSLTRAGRAILPDSDTILKAGDVVHVSATIEGITAFREQMKVMREA